MAHSPTLDEKLKSLPTSPGCYLYKDAAGEIIYVGKAVNLRNRVRSYFQKGTQHTAKTRKLVSRIADLDIVVVDSELEALVLECNLIKQHRPHYNVRMRDDKHYPYLVLTMNEPFPRLLITRKIKTDGSKYFGPFTNSRAVWDSLRLIYRLFPLVTCRKSFDNTPVQRPCLYHQMGRCPHAPCAGLGDKDEYRRMVEDVALFLDGKQDKLVKQLKTEMEAAAEDLQFEKAARLRDQLAAIETLIERQKVVSTNQTDQDIVALVNDQGKSAVQMFFIRNGKLIGQEHFLVGWYGRRGRHRRRHRRVCQAVLPRGGLCAVRDCPPRPCRGDRHYRAVAAPEERHESHTDGAGARREKAAFGHGLYQCQARFGPDAGDGLRRA